MKKYLPALALLFTMQPAHADIVWGAAGPYTGSVAQWGLSQQAGIELAVESINAAGGKLPGAKGVSEEDIAKAGKMGVTKINIDTDGRLVWCRVHREYFAEHPDNFDLRPVGKVFMTEYAKYIAGKNEILGSAGQLESVREYIKNAKG